MNCTGVSTECLGGREGFSEADGTECLGMSATKDGAMAAMAANCRDDQSGPTQFKSDTCRDGSAYPG